MTINLSLSETEALVVLGGLWDIVRSKRRHEGDKAIAQRIMNEILEQEEKGKKDDN